MLDLFDELYPNSSAHDRMSALLHDAAEYVIGDMISPFKAALGLDYKVFEARLDEAVNRRFGLKAPTPPRPKKRIKRCDVVARKATQIAGFTIDEANRFFIAPPSCPDDRSEPRREGRSGVSAGSGGGGPSLAVPDLIRNPWLAMLRTAMNLGSSPRTTRSITRGCAAAWTCFNRAASTSV